MFFYQSIPWYSWAAWIVLLLGLILLNEISRRSKPGTFLLYILIPTVLTIFVWPKTSGPGTGVHTANWFAWVKVYSALAGCWVFMALRFSEKVQKQKWAYILLPSVLAVNILEAVVRELQVRNMQGVIDGMFFMGGPWNYMNAAAGVLNILTICGWFGIYVTRDKYRDAVWPDMTWFWIIAYDLWNFTYVYNCNTDRSFYSGFALLLSCTIPAFFIRKGTWLQSRAHTLALFMMFMLAVPEIFVSGTFAVSSSHDPAAFYTISLISLAFNVGVAVYQILTIFKMKRNPIKDEIYDHLKTTQEIKAS